MSETRLTDSVKSAMILMESTKLSHWGSRRLIALLTNSKLIFININCPCNLSFVNTSLESFIDLPVSVCRSLTSSSKFEQIEHLFSQEGREYQKNAPIYA